MKSLSKFQLVLMMVFGVMAVAGVLIFAFAVGGGSGNSVGPVVVWGTLDQSAFTVVVRQAAENNPQLSQVSYEQKDPATYESDLTNALASGEGPDLFLLRQDFAMKDAGKVNIIPPGSLSQSQFDSTFIQSAAPFLSLSGVIAIPILADPLVLYWNRDVLGSAGYAKPPVYWDEVIPMATFISGGDSDINSRTTTRRDSSNSIQKSAISFGEYRNVDNAKAILSTLILQAGGSITARDTGGHLVPALSPRTAEASQSTDSALRFFTEFSDPSKNVYSWNRSLPDARACFAAGDVGLYVGYASEEPTILKTNPNLNFGIALIPQIRNNDHSINTAQVYGLAVSRASRNPTGAFTAAYLLASSDVSKALSTALGIPSARRDVLSLPAKGDDDLFNRAAIPSRSWIDPDPDKTDEIFRGMIEDTVSGASKLSDAIQRADQEMGHVLGL